jgi:hypothetical protein
VDLRVACEVGCLGLLSLLGLLGLSGLLGSLALLGLLGKSPNCKFLVDLRMVCEVGGTRLAIET